MRAHQPPQDPDPWREAARLWMLDPAVAFLNHGSFGACPRPVLEEQVRWRNRLERQPVAFLERELDGSLGRARAQVAAFLGADPDGLAFVPNATTGVNTVLKQLDLGPGDEIVVTDHAYPAIEHTIATVCAGRGAGLRMLPIPLPLPSEDEIVEGVLAALRPETSVVVLDHVTSQTGAILPVERIVAGCRARGIRTVVDAAHAPAMLPVDVEALGADFWIGNFHKWLCAPKGSGALVVAPAHRELIRPLVTPQPWLERFTDSFDWTGTYDPSAYLTVPAAIEFLAGFGWDRLRARNHGLALQARAVVAEAIGAERLVPDEATGWMAVVPLPDGVAPTREDARAMSAALVDRFGIEVPVIRWGGRSLVRLSVHAYNALDQYESLGAALRETLR